MKVEEKVPVYCKQGHRRVKIFATHAFVQGPRERNHAYAGVSKKGRYIVLWYGYIDGVSLVVTIGGFEP